MLVSTIKLLWVLKQSSPAPSTVMRSMVMAPVWCMKCSASAVVDMIRFGAGFTAVPAVIANVPLQKSHRMPIPAAESKTTLSSWNLLLTL